MFSFVFLLSFYTIKHHFQSLFKRNETILIFALAGFCLLWSGSRGQSLAFIIFLISQFFFKKNVYLGVILSIFLIVVIYMIDVDIASLAKSFGIDDFVRSDTIEEGGGRVVAHNFAWAQIQNNFWIGRGFSYTEWIFHEHELELLQLGHVGNSHNAFLTVWLESGLIGLFLFILGWGILFYNAGKKSKLVLPIAFAVISSNMVESWLIGSLNPFTIQLIILLSILIFFKKKKPFLKEEYLFNPMSLTFRYGKNSPQY